MSRHGNTRLRIATLVALSVTGCQSRGHTQSGQQGGSNGDANAVRPHDAGPESPAHMLRRAACGRISRTTVALGSQARQLDLAFQSGGSRTTSRVRPALGGSVCLLSYETMQSGQPDPDGGVAPGPMVSDLGAEQRRTLLPDAGAGSS
ncbi:MAG: hypothetical protein WCJ30_05605, partial [Deltaproteobacteria bacterium]